MVIFQFEDFLATKTRQRTMEGIENEYFEKSCERLNTDHIDLYLLHNVGSREDLHMALDRDNGAICAFENLREKGRISNIGISTAAIGITTIVLVDENVRLACQYHPCDGSELERMEALAVAAR